MEELSNNLARNVFDDLIVVLPTSGILQHMDMACIFGVPGSANDINVIDRSLLFDDFLEGQAPQVNFTINGR